MNDTTVKISALSAKNVLVNADTFFVILDKGTTIQSPQGSTMTTPASAVLTLVSNAYNLNNLASLYTAVSTNSAKNLSNYTTVNTNSATWVRGAGSSVISVSGNISLDETSLGSIFTDINFEGNSQINLPLLSAAKIHGGTIRVSSGHTYGVDGYVSVYPNTTEWYPNKFLLGSQNLFSLYSTAKGDYLELVPVTQGNTDYWQVLNVVGTWQDRD